jgi:uncharacterized protein
MIVELIDIPEEGLELTFREPVPLGADVGVSPDACLVEAELFLARIGVGVAIRGSFRSTLQFTCCRCLEGFRLALGEAFEVHYLPAREVAPEGEYELSAGELDVLPLQEERIDITALLQENLLLNIPLQPVCRETCCGLCPRCGASLNAGPCGCPERSADPRWDALAKLKATRSRP